MSIDVQILKKEPPDFVSSAGACVLWFDLLVGDKIIYLGTGEGGEMTERQWRYWVEGLITHETLHIVLWKLIRTDMKKLDNIEPALKRKSISFGG